MNQFPYMPLYWNDLLSDNKVRVMSNEELGAYIRLLGVAWHEDIPGTVPTDDDVLARFAGVELSLWRKLSRRILPCFVLNGETGRYEQKRMMTEHAKVTAFVEMKQSRAVAGAEKRWGKKPSAPPPNAQALLKHDLSNANQKQKQNTPHPQGADIGSDSEIPSRETVIGQAANQGIDADFAGMVFDAWILRRGCDFGGNRVDCLPYVVKRWGSERQEWQDQTHKSHPNRNKKNGTHLRTPHGGNGRHAAIDRNAGTSNAGTTSDYGGVGKVARPETIPDLE